MSHWSKLSVVALAVTLIVGWSADVEARFFRLAKVPNSDAVGAGCNLCHTTGGGTPRNPFGLSVEALVTPDGREVFWGPELAAMDSDGDGFTNGEELGDPEGLWQEGGDPPGDPALITHPGDPDSHPPEPVEEPTAVETSTWGKVKDLVKDLVD